MLRPALVLAVALAGCGGHRRVLGSRPEAPEHLVIAKQLPAPHRISAKSLLPPVRSLAELRGLVGRRDKRAPFAVVSAWMRELGHPITVSTAEDLVAWAEEMRRVHDGAPEPGDLVVFDHATGDAAFDLVAIAIARDDRGVTELVYVGGGVVRRGFLDASRPRLRRDGFGRVVNTYLRHGKRWPPKGTHYLAGELVSRVIRVR
ncbi:MAG: CHAP domain-containing protein [Kofleriaceae bacterium]